jgi:hypothetical protein
MLDRIGLEKYQRKDHSKPYTNLFYKKRIEESQPVQLLKTSIEAGS